MKENVMVKPEVVADDKVVSASKEIGNATIVTASVLCLCVGVWAFACVASALVSTGGVAGLATSFAVAIGMI